MSKTVEVLVACMDQTNSDLYEIMNLNTNAIFANQCKKYNYEIEFKNGNILKIISTNDKGVGKNRNIAILNSSGDYLLFADEDMIYEDDYQDTVINAFKMNQKADIIVFNLEYKNTITQGKKRRIQQVHRLFWFNSLRYGAARIAIKRDSLLKSNLWFSLLYGGGAKYSSGEDSLFIREALRKNLKIYAHPGQVAVVKQEKSTWFTGYNDKFYFDKGYLIANMFPVLKYGLVLYYAYKYKNTSKKHTYSEILRLMLNGIKGYDRSC
jgi:glycosyltransferase involved in cell wall biosynthesis